LNLEPRSFYAHRKIAGIAGCSTRKFHLREKAVSPVEGIGQIGQPAGPIGRWHFGWYAEHRRPLSLSCFKRV
jgi:hypothetical protein